MHVTAYISFAEEDGIAGISIAQGLTICITCPNPTKNQLHKHINSLKPSLHLVILLNQSTPCMRKSYILYMHGHIINFGDIQINQL
jgi:hypothetical protein